MPFPFAPSEIKDLIPRPGGNFCEKFLKSLNLNAKVHAFVSYLFTESGGFTDDFQADICNLSCKCGPGGVIVPGGLAAPIVSASDGQFSDRVMITWNPPSGALQYDLYRAGTNAPGGTLLASNLQSTSYEDTTVTPSTYYYYSVRAKNATATSGFSNVDRGYAGAISTTLAGITDLFATQGTRIGAPQTIGLIFSPVAGADSYDIYRNTVDDFGSATLIDSNRVPYDNSNVQSSGPAPYFVDNVGELLYAHDPGAPNINYFTKYYFWVIAKRSGPPAQGPPSNSGSGALGWAVGRGDGAFPVVTGVFLQDGSTGGPSAAPNFTVTAGTVKCWVVLYGSGSAGAGGGPLHGGGAGAAGPILTGEVNVVTGAKFRVISVPTGNGPASAASEIDGGDGSQSKLQYSALGDWSDVIDLLVGNAPTGGDYNAAGAGAGGVGSTGTKHASVTSGAIYPGRNGLPGSTPKGGRSGYRVGEVRKPAATNGSFGSPAGSGGTAHGSSALARASGRGINATATIVPYTF